MGTRGDGIPDVTVLKTLADVYGITVNDFLVVHIEKQPKLPAKNRKGKALACFAVIFWLGLVCGDDSYGYRLAYSSRPANSGIRLYRRFTCVNDSCRGILLYLGPTMDESAFGVRAGVVVLRYD